MPETTADSPHPALREPIPALASAITPARWNIRLLGAVEAHGDGRSVLRLPSRAAAQLLARLALAPDKAHPREELVELLWPGVALDVGRNRLRQVLSSLKHELESPGQGPVIVADRMVVRAAPGALACDARTFEHLVRSGHWEQAHLVYRGELLPGHYEEWVLEERGRLNALFDRLEAMPRLPPSPPPAPAPAKGAGPGQLPHYWTRLFGVEINAARLRDAVCQHRLVTVLGAGGSGKTRLAVEVARALATPTTWAQDAEAAPIAFERVVFVSLIDCDQAHLAVDAIANALQVSGRDTMASIAAVLAAQRTLLVLDNLEQLATVAEGVVRRLLTDTGDVHVLITSRLRLGMDGEHVFELAGLALPGPTQGLPTAKPMPDSAATALFLDRARAASPAFRPSDDESTAIHALVHLLAGMPLAIELAASRIRSLAPRALLNRLGTGETPLLDLLSRDGGGTNLAQRHASMRHVVAWSWRQLDEPLVAVMQAMAVFGAPARCDTVAAVAGLPTRTAHERLEQLRDHSLVVAQWESEDEARYVLLQPVREFVVERLPAAQAAAGRQRLRQWLIEFGQACAARGHLALHEVDAELPQVYAAILGAAADGPAGQNEAARVAVSMRRHWEVDTRAGLPRSVSLALEAALPVLDDDTVRCDLCLLLGFSCALAGLQADALALIAQAKALAHDPRRRAMALMRWAHVAIFSGGDQSGVDAALAEALALAQEAGDLECQGLALRMQFLVTVNRDDDHARGEQMARQVQALWEQLGHRRNAYSGLMDRASCWIALGRHDEAATALAACEQVARQERHATGHIMAAWQLGRALLKLRRPQEAMAAYQRCLQGSWEHKRMAYVADALVLLPGGMAFANLEQAAARLQGFAVAHWQRQFGGFYRDLDRDVRHTRRWLVHRLGATQYEALRLEGATLTLAEAVALGLEARAGTAPGAA